MKNRADPHGRALRHEALTEGGQCTFGIGAIHDVAQIPLNLQQVTVGCLLLVHPPRPEHTECVS